MNDLKSNIFNHYNISCTSYVQLNSFRLETSNGILIRTYL